MKRLKFGSIWAFLTMAVFGVASLLMGCSGGAAVDDSSGGGASGGFAPDALAAGMIFSFSGDFSDPETKPAISFYGKIEKRLTITSPTTGDWVDEYYTGSQWPINTGTSTLTYTKTSGDTIVINATKYRCVDGGFLTEGTVGISIRFTSATEGTFKEKGVTSTTYTGTGTFTLIPVTNVP